jgi:hypothetical protein
MSFSPEEQISRFFYFLDERRYDRLLQMFTPDARWLRQGKLLSGHEEIQQVLLQRAPGMRVRHVVSNLVRLGPEDLPVEHQISYFGQAKPGTAPASTACVSCYMTAYRVDNAGAGEPPWTTSGPYKFSIVHTRFVLDNGLWRICEKQMLPQFTFKDAASGK